MSSPVTIEQTPRRMAMMGDVGKILRQVGAKAQDGAFEGPCPSCKVGCTVQREDHYAILVQLDERDMYGWAQCPKCRTCSSTWGSKVPPERCSWGANLTDELGRISNDRCLNESKAQLFVTDDVEPGVRSTVHLCVGHLAWVQEHMQLDQVDPSTLN